LRGGSEMPRLGTGRIQRCSKAFFRQLKKTLYVVSRSSGITLIVHAI
jgi:hypothetical protein